MGLLHTLKHWLGIDHNHDEARGLDLRVVNPDIIAQTWRAEYNETSQQVELHILGVGFGEVADEVNVANVNDPTNQQVVDVVSWSDGEIIVKGLVDEDLRHRNQIIFHTNLLINVPTKQLATISDFVKRNPVGTRFTTHPRTPVWTVGVTNVTSDGIVITGTKLDRVASVVLVDSTGLEYYAPITFTAGGATQITVPFPDGFTDTIVNIYLVAPRGRDIPYKQTLTGTWAPMVSAPPFTFDDLEVVNNDFFQNDLYLIGTGFQAVDSIDTLVANVHGGTINLDFTVVSDTNITIQYTGPLTIVDSWTLTGTLAGTPSTVTLDETYYLGRDPDVTVPGIGIVTITDPNSNGHSFGAKWDKAQIFLIDSNNVNPSYTSSSSQWSVVGDAIVINDPAALAGWTISHIQMQGSNYHGLIIPNVSPQTEIDIPAAAGAPTITTTTGALPNLDITGTNLDTVTTVSAVDELGGGITLGMIAVQAANHLLVDYAGPNIIVSGVSTINPTGRGQHLGHFLIGSQPVAASVTHGISITAGTGFKSLWGAVQIKLEDNSEITYNASQFVAGSSDTVEIVDATLLTGHTIVEVTFLCIQHETAAYDMTGLTIAVT